MGQSGKTYHKAIDRMETLLDIARSLSADTPYLLAKTAGIPSTSAYRQIASMEESRMLARDMQGRFMPGAECVRLCFSAWGFQDPGFVSEPLLRFVRIQTRQTAFFGFLRQGVLQLGPYSIGRGNRFAHPVATGHYELRTKLKDLNAGRYQLRDGEAARTPVVLCPIVQNEEALLVLGVFRHASPETELGKITNVLRDAAQRLRAGVSFQSEYREP